MTKISIITPTSEREKKLRLLYKVILAQDHKNYEWLICDSSYKPSSFFQKTQDEKVKYFYDLKNLTIGEKRNLLKSKATGDYIVHFDDDDYYSPHYISRIRQELKDCDFCKLTAFFCYSAHVEEFFYWHTTQFSQNHFSLSPLNSKTIDIKNVAKFQKQSMLHNKKGYGFSFAYTKKVAQKIDFKNVNLAEDYAFLSKAQKEKFKVKFLEDNEGLALHIIHDMNTSSVIPQYRIPPFLMKKLFSSADSYLKKYPTE
jgi:glycosyltransferase involved in cell wall biosynthesis